MAGKWRVTGIYAVLHFLVDFCCAFFMFRLMADDEQFYLILFWYNFCAFALQMPIGLLADKWNRNALAGTLGAVLVAISLTLGVFLNTGSGLFLAILAGLGNCLFHLGGGIETLNRGKDRLAPLGVFVSPGAAGLFLGTLLGKGSFLPWFVPVALLLIGAAVLLMDAGKGGSLASQNAPLSFREGENNGMFLWAAVLLLFLVVVLRSYLGMIFAFPWKRTEPGSILYLTAVVGGKIAGGFLADRIGIKKTACISLAASALLFLGADRAIWGGLAVCLFNMSMPITLFLAARLLSGCKGFAFGLLTFSIFLGFLPAYFGYQVCTPFTLAVLGAASALLLTAGSFLSDGAGQLGKQTGQPIMRGEGNG